MPLSHEARTARARLARASRSDGDPVEAESLRRDFRYMSARDYIREVVDSAPPLTDAQLRSLAKLLVGGDAA